MSDESFVHTVVNAAQESSATLLETVNSVGNDAPDAGLSPWEKAKVAFDGTQRSAQDVISLLQTAEDAMKEAHDVCAGAQSGRIGIAGELASGLAVTPEDAAEIAEALAVGGGVAMAVAVVVCSEVAGTSAGNEQGSRDASEALNGLRMLLRQLLSKRLDKRGRQLAVTRIGQIAQSAIGTRKRDRAPRRYQAGLEGVIPVLQHVQPSVLAIVLLLRRRGIFPYQKADLLDRLRRALLTTESALQQAANRPIRTIALKPRRI